MSDIWHFLIVKGGSYAALCGTRHAVDSTSSKRSVTCKRCRRILFPGRKP